MVNDTVALLAEARYMEGDVSHIALITGTGEDSWHTRPRRLGRPVLTCWP